MGMTPGNKPPSAPAAELVSAQWESECSQRVRPANKNKNTKKSNYNKNTNQSCNLFSSDPARLCCRCVDPLQQLVMVVPLRSPAADFTVDAA